MHNGADGFEAQTDQECGDDYAQRNEWECVFEFDAEQISDESAGPSAGYREWNGDKCD